MKKIVVSSLVSLLSLSCSVYAPDNYSLVTSYSSSVTNYQILEKNNFAALEDEYKSFKTKALSDAYVKRMFNKYLSTTNSVQLIRQLEFSRYLKQNSDSNYETSLKNIFDETPALYDQMTGISSITNKMTNESPTFGNYVRGLSPYPGIPLALPATPVSSTLFIANWQAVNRATSYKLYVNGDMLYSGPGTSYSVPTIPGFTGTYYVQSVNSRGISGNSNTVSVSLLPETPNANAASNITQTSFRANWNAASGATSYKIIIDNGTPVNVGNVLYYDKSSLSVGSTHTYSVQAVNSSGTTESSNTVSVTLNPAVPSPPTATDATNITMTSFRANWNLVSGATSYNIIVDNGTPVNVGNVSYHNLSGLISGSNHNYYVQAVNSSGTSLNSNTISLTLGSVNYPLLDTHTNAAAAFSVRKLSTAYNGYAIRVRRSSDNAEQNIGFDGNNNLSTTALSSFVGSGNGFVTTWYDQSGNNKNATQSVIEQQPQIVSNGTIITDRYRPAIQFDGTGDNISIPSITTSTQSYFSVLSRQGLAGGSYAYHPIITGAGVDHWQIGVLNSTNQYMFYVYGSMPSSFYFSTAQHLINLNGGTTNLNAYQNGNAGPSVATSEVLHTTTYNIGQYDYKAFANMKMSEFIFFAGDRSSTRTSIESNINSYYSIY